MKTFKIALLAASATLAMSGAALADDALTVSYNVGAASDYVFRGVSQTDENPQIFAGVDVAKGMVYGGLWASNVDFGDDTSAEIDVYAGVKPTIGPVTLDLGAIYYGYVNEPSNADWAYWEFKAAGSMPVGPATVGAAVFYSPDQTGAFDESFYYELNGSVPVAKKVTISGAVGRQTYSNAFDWADYTTWNLGAGYAVNEHFGLDLRYFDTDEELGHLYGSRVVASVKAAF